MSFEKPLPSPAWDDAPSLPPKIITDGDDSRENGISLPPPISVSASFSSLSLTPGSNSRPQSPRTPRTPTTPNSPPASESKTKKANPLTDLNETEKLYVEQLTGVIRKVAGAWSRSNLPPPELDVMFRSVESVYKANRNLYNKLKEIGTNPTSPKPLGDLLMRWIDDLDTPYSTYCSRYRTGFDNWGPVANNSRLPGILATFSESCPPPPPDTVWSLDALFDLPALRIKYYRKLYSRLLKSTTPGRNDHKALTAAIEKLDGLLGILESRANEYVGGAPNGGATTATAHVSPPQPSPVSSPPPHHQHQQQHEDAPLSPPPPPPPSYANEDLALASPPKPHLDAPRPESGNSSAPSGYASSDQRFSNETGNTSISRVSTQTMSMPITDLERRLSTKRTLDIFSMKPKAVRLQISPPQLTYTRSLRFSTDAVITVTPRATGQEIIYRNAHIFLLSDLFLMCERMTNEERAIEESELGKDVPQAGGPDMWLIFPPLAGKVLRVADEPERGDAVFSIAIMRKETLYVHVESPQAKAFMIKEMKECIEFASSVGPVSKNPPPPMPPLPANLMQPQPKPHPDYQNEPMARVVSPPHMNGNGLPSRPGSGSNTSGSFATPPNQSRETSPHNSMMMGGPNGAYHGPNPNGAPFQRAPSLQAQHVQGVHPPPRMSSTNDYQQGGVVPPMRSTSVGPPPGPQRGMGMGMGGPMPPPPHHQHMAMGGMHNGGPLPPHPPHYMAGHMPPQHHMGNPPPPPPHHMGGPPPHMSGPAPPPHHMGPPPPINTGDLPMNGSLGSPGGYRGQSPYGLPNNPRSSGPDGYPHSGPSRAPSVMSSHQGSLRKSPSSRSLNSQYDPYSSPPPPMPNQLAQSMNGMPLHAPQPRTLLPSAHMATRGVSMAPSAMPSFDEPSPPGSPVEETEQHTGPVTSTISAQMKCKVFLKQQHAQWKSLGSARLKLYREDPTNIKQLVVEADNKNNSVLISTIVLTDGVERVGKTGVAVELSDRGARTGIVYMIQLRSEKSAGGLFDSLLAGSDRVIS